MVRQQRYVNLAFVCLFLSLCLYSYLTVHHYDLQYGMRSSKSLCNVNPHMDCDAVNSSSFSEFLGIPVALWGAFSVLVQMIFLLGVRALSEEEKARPARFFFYLSWLSVLASLGLAVVQSLVLKNFCLFCLSLYVLNFIVLFCAYKIKASKVDFPMLWKDLSGSLASVMFLLVIPVGAYLTHEMYKQYVVKDVDRFVSSSLQDWREGRKIDFYIPTGPRIGSSQPKLQLIEFSDFECPHCKRAAPSLHAFVTAHRDDVQLIYQSYPLSSSCNPHMKSEGHTAACALARAAFCADKQGKFQQAHDWIFEHQEGISESSIPTMAAAVELNLPELETCMKSPETAQDLSAQIERGFLAGIQGTPSVFANGKMLPGGFMIPVLEAALKESR